MKATELINLSEADIVHKIYVLCKKDALKTGVCAEVSLAQFILESGYGKTELAQNANNCFGMKKVLSGNTWPGTTWDGKTVYSKKTEEQDKNGKVSTITAPFRAYPSIEKSIADHSAYLLGAKNGSAPRYAGLKGEKDPQKAITIIKNGGYATDTKYIDKIMSIVKRWCNVVPQPVVGSEYMIKVNVPALWVRSGAGTNYKTNGKITDGGVYTIVDTDGCWGKLKSGAGWICLDYCSKR